MSLAIDLDGRCALITGGSRGIGRAMALAFAEAGARVGIVYAKRDDAAEETAAEVAKRGPAALLLKGSVSDADAVDRMCTEALQRWGQIDVLVNNAGITRDIYLPMMSDESWDEVIDTNLRSAYLCTKRVIKPMIARRQGVVLNMSSQSAVHGRIGQTNYAASKAALLGFTKSLAREMGRYDIRVNALITGLVDTDMTKSMPSKILRPILEQIPLARMGRPEEIANLATFLASDLASYITGSCIEIAGGL